MDVKTFCSHERKHGRRSLTTGLLPSVADCFLSCYSFMQVYAGLRHFLKSESEWERQLTVSLLHCVTSGRMCDTEENVQNVRF